MASDIAFYVGQWNTDGWYDASQFNDVDTIIDLTGHMFGDIQQFDDNEFAEFGAWVDARTDDGVMDIIWLNGCLPSVLYPLQNASPDGSRAEEWLDGGNMIINVGDWFAFVSYETGSRVTPENTGTGAANILDLAASIIAGSGQGAMVVTPTGREYLPSLNQVTSGRPVSLSAVVAPWEVAAIFAQNAAGTYADPVVLHNTATGGYLAIINQASTGNWIADRGLTCAEFIANWVSIVLYGQPLATGPNPKDGAVYTATWVSLGWQPGDFAVSHDVYIGDNFDDVDAGTGGTFQGNTTDTCFIAGFSGYPLPEGLNTGTTYYWRIDEVNDLHPDSPWKGKVWSFWIQPKKAYSPNPLDGSRFIKPGVTLTWTAGFGAKVRYVYFGEDFDTVNNATEGTRVVSTSYTPNTLERDKTYYWRVDESDGYTTYKGDVWSFTTAKAGGGIRADYYHHDGGTPHDPASGAFGTHVLTRIDPQINFNWGDPGSPDASINVDDFSAIWTGEVEAAFTETYTFYTNTDDGVILWVDGQEIIRNWTNHSPTENSGTIDLVAGQTYSIEMWWYERGGGAVAELRWSSPRTPKQLVP